WTIASSPMVSTNSPATLWLNSDHARSAAVRGASRSSTGSASIGGDESVGHLGVNRVTTSASVARSVTTSTAGGSEVSDAATNRVVRPRPSSTSTSRRSRAEPTSASGGSRRTATKFSAPRSRRAARIATLVSTIMPYAVPSSGRTPPTNASVSARPPATRIPTAVSASAEKRRSKSAGHQPGAGEDADGDRPDVGRGEEVPDGPAVIAGQRAETDGEREELRDTDDGCTHRRECEAPVEQRHEGGPRVHRGPEDQQRKQ